MGILSGLFVACVGLAEVVQPVRAQADHDAFLDRLERSFPGVLPVEVLLAAGRDGESGAGEPPPPAADLLAVAALVSEVEEAAASAPAASTLRRRGLLRLAQRRPDEAVNDLRLALAHPGVAAAIGVELASAYLSRHGERGDGLDLALALERASAAARANEGSGGSALAVRALALDGLGLPHSALLDWRESAAGAGPARRRQVEEMVDRLEQELAEQPPPFGESELLERLAGRVVAWSVAELEDPGGGGQPFRDLHPPSAESRAWPADSFVGIVGAELDTLRVGARQALPSLARLPIDAEAADCGAFGEARAAVDAAAPTLGLWIAFLEAGCLYHEDLVAAEQLLDRIAPRLRPDDAAARGMVHRLRGLVRFARSDLAGAFDDHRRSRDAFEQAGDAAGLVAADRELGDLYFLLGDDLPGWAALLRALSGSRATSGDRRFGTVAALFDRLMALNLLDAAGEVSRELERAATSPNLDVVALTLRAHSERLAGRPSKSREALEQGERVLERITGPRAAWLRSDLLREWARLDLAEGGIEQALARIGAVQSIDAGLGRSHQQESDARLQGLAHLARGELEAAREELFTALELELAGIDDAGDDPLPPAALEPDWLELLVDRWSARDAREAVGAVLAIVSALSPANRGRRARVLRERTWAPPWVAPRGDGDATVVYSFVPGGLVCWVLRSGRVHQQRLPVAREEVAALVSRFRIAVTLGADRLADDAATELFDRLILPVEALLGGSEDLRLVVLGPLLELPFAALLDRRDGRYLVERWSVATIAGVTPAASVAVATAAEGPLDLLMIRGAEGAADIALPELDREIASVLASWEGASSGVTTSLAALQATIENARTIHLAGHLYAVPFPASAFTVPLAGPGDAALTSELVRRLDLSRSELVYVSTCRGRGSFELEPRPDYGLATAFLEARARGVVASLWDLDDRAALGLATAFHRSYVDGEDAAGALRVAQAGAIARGEPLRAWAGLRYVGVAELEPVRDTLPGEPPARSPR
ncbi:MAG TPA: CHAT domain-containing protein [Thermoanaerobaculia bacterium]|nr:CHAT domain-containing protein [Thermoanaerobaculia bacterium]